MSYHQTLFCVNAFCSYIARGQGRENKQCSDILLIILLHLMIFSVCVCMWSSIKEQVLIYIVVHRSGNKHSITVVVGKTKHENELCACVPYIIKHSCSSVSVADKLFYLKLHTHTHTHTEHSIYTRSLNLAEYII